MSSTEHYDMVIIGGGLVGATLALSLRTLSLRIAIVEAVLPQLDQQPSFDDRSVVLSYGSVRFMQAMGLWESLSAEATPIAHIHVSDQGFPGICRFHAEDYEVSALGYVIENRCVGTSLYALLQESDNIDLYSPATVDDLIFNESEVKLTLSSKTEEKQKGNQVREHQTLTASLVVAADGSYSSIANYLQLNPQRYVYSQSAIVSNVETSKPHHGWAYERFTQHGPIAMLPLSRQRWSLVWSIPEEQKETLLNVPEKDFLQHLQEAFGFRCGTFTKVGRRHAYPLSHHQQQDYYHRTLFIGNALHTTHPVAGQGFNLGLRDIAVLTECIAKAKIEKKDIGSHHLLNQFVSARKGDTQTTIMATHHMIELFTKLDYASVFLRSSLLKGLDQFDYFKTYFAREFMGLRQDLPGLARGIPLHEVMRQWECMNHV